MAQKSFGRGLSKQARKEMMRDLADTFIDRLQEGDFGAWSKSWASLGMDAMPHNVRGSSYRGINTIILWLSGFEYDSAQWGTYDQWKKLAVKHAISKGEFELVDGRKGPWKKTTKWYGVKKGEAGTTIIFWKPSTYKKENKDTGEDEDRVSFLLRTYTVFNRSQTDLPPLEKVEGSEMVAKDFSTLEKDLDDCLVHYMETAKGGPIQLKHGGDRAFYTPSRDRIALPLRKQFKTNLHYLSVKGHECIHSTGHALRENRANMNRFGSEDYAFEELVAELGSAFMMGAFGLQGEMLHAEYLASWVRILNDEPEALMKAATKAQKAVDFVVDPYIEHSRFRAEDEDPCDCKRCKDLAEMWGMGEPIFPMEMFYENFHPTEVVDRVCPHLDYTDELDGAKCNHCGESIGDEEE